MSETQFRRSLDRVGLHPVVESIRPAWKRKLHLLLEHPNSSPSAFIIHFITTGLIVFSSLVTIIETIPAFHRTSPKIWFGMETSLVVLFTAEYLGRCFAWSGDRYMFFEWFKSFFSIIDLLAIVPYYIEIAIRADTSSIFRFSILRTFRLFRVFRPFRYSNTIVFTIEVMFLSFKRSKDALLALAFFVLMTLVVFSTLIYFAERGTWDSDLEVFVNTDNRPTQFESIPAAAWYVLVTISTVGYGEITPRSFLGRLFTIPLLLFGLLLIALPSFVLGREFSSLWESMGGTKNREPLENGDDHFGPDSPIPLNALRNASTFDLRQVSSRPRSNSLLTTEERYRVLVKELQETRMDVAQMREEFRELKEMLLKTRPTAVADGWTGG